MPGVSHLEVTFGAKNLYGSRCGSLTHHSGQSTIIPKPEGFGDFGGDSRTKPPFGVTSPEVAIIGPNIIGPFLVGDRFIEMVENL